MSTLVQDITSEAVAMVGDPRANRVDAADLLLFYNRAQRMVVERIHKVLETEATFDFVADKNYFYPDDCLQVTSLWYNQSPTSDPERYLKLAELKRESWLNRMQAVTTGDPAEVYFRRGFFQVFPTPSSVTIDGGKIIYWRYPAKLTTLTSQFLELPDHMDRLVIDAMKTRLFEKLRLYDEARASQQAWEAAIADMADVAVDRGDDRRQSLRPRGYSVGTTDQN